jgi:signal transduction histidine kinase
VVDTGRALAPLAAQMKTLLTRLRVLDPVVGGARQVKEQVDLATWVPNIVASTRTSLEAVGIAVEVRAHGGPLSVKVVPGMVVQVLENLLSNAGYWLRRRRLNEPSFRPRVRVEVDSRDQSVLVSDNGPGVPPTMRESIFQAFVSTKPSGEGWGLGLFIAREIAQYSGADLLLAELDETPTDMTTTFILRFQ